MTIEFIDLNDPKWNFTFSNIVKADNFIFTSHIGGFVDKNGNIIGDIESQTKQCFENLKEKLTVANSSLKDVIKVNVLLKNSDLEKRQENFKKMKEVYRGYFEKGKYPVRTGWFTEFLDDTCLIQIDAIAYRRSA